MRTKLDRRIFATVASVAFATVLGAPWIALADGYPEKKIEWIVMWRSGGGADTATRIFTKHLEEILGTEIVIQNITGGGGAIGYTAAKGADPDGYTLVTIQGDLPKFEPKGLAPIAIDDFDILGGFAFQSPVVAARADAPWDTLEEFIADAKANPGERTIAISDIGGTYHQPTALWADAAGFDAKVVVFEGSPQQTVGLLGGHVDIAVTWVKPNISYVEEDKIKFLGYMASERLPDYPDVPTLKELGYDVVWEHPYGVGGPRGMPEEAKAMLEEATKQVWDIPEFAAELEKLGLSVFRRDAEAYREHMHKMQADTTKALALIEQQ